MGHVWLQGYSDDTAAIARADTLTALVSTPTEVTGRFGNDVHLTLARATHTTPLPTDFHIGLLAHLGHARHQATELNDDIVISCLADAAEPRWTSHRATDLW